MRLLQKTQKEVEIEDEIFVTIFNGRHRVSKVRQNNATGNIIEEYTYDQDGNRLKKVTYNIDAQGNNKTTYYISEDFVQERITNGTILNYTYYYLSDKLVAMKNPSGEKFYYHSDHLGSTTLVTNQSGDVVEDDVYLPYGAIYNGDGKARFLYTGKEFDAETEMYYYGARYYDPRFMHFVQCDSIKPDIYDPQALNCYAYVLNNPYKYTDPDGRKVELVTGGLYNRYVYTGDSQILSAVSSITGSIASRFTHSYFDVTPDNPSDFDWKTNFQLGAYASDGIFDKDSKLVYAESKDQEGQRTEYSRALLNTPEGKTDTQFINDLINEGNKLNAANVPYDALPGNLLFGPGENSNSFATTAIESTGSSLPSGTNYKDLSPGAASPGLGRSIDYKKYSSQNQNKIKGFSQYYPRFKSFFNSNRNNIARR